MSSGTLFLLNDDGSAEEVESEFASKQEASIERKQKFSPWGQQDDSSMGALGYDIWGGHNAANHLVRYKVIEVVRVDEDTLIYVMSNGSVTGLFEYNITTKTERRILHRNDFSVEGIAYDAASNKFCAGQHTDEGTVDLAVMDEQGRIVSHLNGGDSWDVHLSYSMKNPKEVLFQSSGIDHDEENRFLMLGPSGINKINLERDAFEELLFDEEFDYLIPKEGPDGALYCIRRPFKSEQRLPLWKSFVHFLMAPVYSFQAIYNFLKIFTQMFKDTPNLASGPKLNQPEQEQHIQVLGRVINVGKSRKQNEDE